MAELVNWGGRGVKGGREGGSGEGKRGGREGGEGGSDGKERWRGDEYT